MAQTVHTAERLTASGLDGIEVKGGGEGRAIPFVSAQFCMVFGCIELCITRFGCLCSFSPAASEIRCVE